MNWRNLFNRLRGKTATFDEELAEELEFHRAMTEVKLGDSAAARRAIGNSTLAIEQARDAWAFVWLRDFAMDVRYGLRALAANKTFTLATAGALTLGLGVTGVVFSIFNTLLFAPWNIRDAGSVVQVLSASWIGSSSYHSMQIKSERRFSQGLSYLASFTFSKLINRGENGDRDPLGNRNLDRGISLDSAPYRFTVAPVYELAFGKGRQFDIRNRALDAIAGGWEVSAIGTIQAGFPLNPGNSIDTCNCGSATYPNLSRNPNLAKGERTVNRWFDTTAFSSPAQWTIGNAGRGSVWGPGLKSIDFTISKYFNFTERLRLQYRAEAYNLSNSPYFANPNVTVGAGTFGRITAVSNSARQMQMALKLYF